MLDRTFVVLLTWFAVLAFFSNAVIAQVADPVTAAEAPVPGAGHHYIGIGAETVNPADGSLSFDLPFQPPSGRGLNFAFGIRFSGTEQYYLSNQFPGGGGPNLTWTPNWYPAGEAPWQVGAWSYDLPIVTFLASVYRQQYIPDPNCPNGVCQFHLNQCFGADNYTFRGLDGKQELLGVATNRTGTDNNQSNFCGLYANGNPIQNVSPGNNGHGVVAAFQSNSMAPSVTVVDQSGTTYQFPGRSDFGAPTLPWMFGSLASSITDRN